MSEWLAIAEWERCVELARPGIVFEMRNAEGQSLFTPCVPFLPQPPFDWASPAREFRAVVEKPPQHSTPLPPEKG
jgi:hypothetical protein